MNERDEFLRDRLQPDRPEHPRRTTARSAIPRDHRSAPPRSSPPPAPPRSPAFRLPLAAAARGAPACTRRRPFPPPAATSTRLAPPPAAARWGASHRLLAGNRTWPRRGYRPPTPASHGGPPRPRSPTAGGDASCGWLTFGLIKLGPSAAQRQEAQFEAAIRTRLHGNHKVGVLGKGGVGKDVGGRQCRLDVRRTPQQDHVVAIDADTAFGRLSSRIDPRTTGSFWELTADKNLQSFTDVTARVGRNSAGLYVLGGEPAAGPRRVLDPAIYREAALRLDRHFTISVIDCGSTMDSPVTQEVLRDLDALIVVSSPWADGASAAARTMEWLSDQGLTELLHNTHRGAQRFRRPRRQTHPGAAGPRVRRSRAAGGRGALRPPSAARRRHRREPRNGRRRHGANSCRSPR